MLPIKEMIYVGVGGFIGANARYFLTAWFALRVGKWFGWTNLPYGTLFVNVTGSFLLAMFGVWFSRQMHWSEHLRLLVATGFFGAFTTFSTFANESVVLVRGELPINGIAYILLTNLLCLVGVVFGLWIAEHWW